MRSRCYAKMAALLFAASFAASCGSSNALPPGDGGGGSGGGSGADGGGQDQAGGNAGDAGGASDSPAGDSSGGGVSIDDLADKAAAAYCKAYQRCMGPFFAIVFKGIECGTQLGRQFEDGFGAALKQSVADKRVTYHGDRVQACLDAIDAAGCAVLDHEILPACQSAMEGAVVPGGACTINDECAGLAYCKASGMCPGTCASLEAAGAACRRNEDCQSGFVCSGKCTKPAAAGQTCEGPGGPPCQAGTLCLGGSSSKAGTCAKITDVFGADTGAPCDIQKTQLCKTDLVCTVQSAAMGVIVSTCAAPVASGAACKFALPDPCPGGEYCNADISKGQITGTCAKLPTTGQTCATVVFGQSCAGYATCDGASNTCKDLGRLGAMCTTNNLCYSSRCSGGVCVTSDDCSPP